MAKIVVEHATKMPKVKLNVFIDEVKVGQISNQVPLEVKVPAGEHQLHIGFSTKKTEGIGVPFHAEAGKTRKIKTSLGWSSLFAAKQPEFWAIFVCILITLLIEFFTAMDKAPVPFYKTVLFPGLGLGLVVHFLLKMRQKKNSKNFIEIEVLK